MTKRSINFCLLLLATLMSSGCWLRLPNEPLFETDDYMNFVAREVEYRDVTQASRADRYGTAASPHSLANAGPRPHWDLSLDEAIQIALSNSKVLRDIGGTILNSPTTARTVHDASIVETDPRFGVEAALSAFDAQFAMTKNFQNNDRTLNNEIVGGGTRQVKQDLNAYQAQISKRAATGTIFTLRSNVDYDANNSPRNLFGSAWNVNFEGQFRHPLAQGGGVMFNRIAGPNGTPGQFNGVVIARINTDISLAEFETSLRDLISDVENSYWELYFAYRDLEVKLEARDRALKVWRSVSALEQLPKGAADREAQAREQYFRFDGDVKNALSGRLLPRSSSRQGIAANLFGAQSGVFVSERKLRLLLGLPSNDGRLIRPSAEPVMARVVFDWSEIAAEALTRRAELRRQRAIVDRSELALLAAKNFLLPRVDAVGTYRFRCFGHDLISANRGKPRFDNAFADLTTGDFQEWELGLEMSFPIGFRQAHSGIRNAQLRIARSRAVLEEQERIVIHDLSNAIAELNRAWDLVQSDLNRVAAAKQQLEILEKREQLGITVDLNLLLDAQRRKADAGQAYFRALAEYALAVKNVHFTKGSLTEYNNVFLSQDPAEPVAAPLAEPADP